MKKEVLTQDKVIIHILNVSSNHETTLEEVKACCDALCQTISDLKSEEFYDNQLNINVDDIMSHVMSRRSYYNLDVNGKTIRLKNSCNIRDLAREYNLPIWMKNIVNEKIAGSTKTYEKRK